MGKLRVSQEINNNNTEVDILSEEFPSNRSINDRGKPTSRVEECSSSIGQGMSTDVFQCGENRDSKDSENLCYHGEIEEHIVEGKENNKSQATIRTDTEAESNGAVGKNTSMKEQLDSYNDAIIEHYNEHQSVNRKQVVKSFDLAMENDEVNCKYENISVGVLPSKEVLFLDMPTISATDDEIKGTVSGTSQNIDGFFYIDQKSKGDCVTTEDTDTTSEDTDGKIENSAHLCGNSSSFVVADESLESLTTEEEKQVEVTTPQLSSETYLSNVEYKSVTFDETGGNSSGFVADESMENLTAVEENQVEVATPQLSSETYMSNVKYKSVTFDETSEEIVITIIDDVTEPKSETDGNFMLSCLDSFGNSYFYLNDSNEISMNTSKENIVQEKFKADELANSLEPSMLEGSSKDCNNFTLIDANANIVYDSKNGILNTLDLNENFTHENIQSFQHSNNDANEIKGDPMSDKQYESIECSNEDIDGKNCQLDITYDKIAHMKDVQEEMETAEVNHVFKDLDKDTDIPADLTDLNGEYDPRLVPYQTNRTATGKMYLYNSDDSGEFEMEVMGEDGSDIDKTFTELIHELIAPTVEDTTINSDENTMAKKFIIESFSESVSESDAQEKEECLRNLMKDNVEASEVAESGRTGMVRKSAKESRRKIQDYYNNDLLACFDDERKTDDEKSGSAQSKKKGKNSELLVALDVVGDERDAMLYEMKRGKYGPNPHIVRVLEDGTILDITKWYKRYQPVRVKESKPDIKDDDY